MRDPERIDKFLTRLGIIWKKHPDLRFTQLVMNGNNLSYYLEDEEYINILEKVYLEWENKNK